MSFFVKMGRVRNAGNTVKNMGFPAEKIPGRAADLGCTVVMEP